MEQYKRLVGLKSKWPSLLWGRVAFMFLFFFALGAYNSFADDVIRVTGRVVSNDKKQPLFGVNVTDMSTKKKLTETDTDGRFAVNTYANGTLRFSMVGANTLTVKVKGRTYIEVELEMIDNSLGEAVATAKRIKDEVRIPETQMERRGDTLFVPIRVILPAEMFRQDRRLVVQPFFKNVTKKSISAMKPLIYDAKNYHTTQNRMYDFDMNARPNGDPLAKHVTIQSAGTRDTTVKSRRYSFGHVDTIISKDRRDKVQCQVFSALENYKKIVWRDTTVIANGTINPLYWMEYSFEPMVITDTAYYPKVETQLRDSKGEVNLQFVVGKAVLADTPQNTIELEKLRESINAVVSNKDASLQNLSVEGLASPDGNYNSNLRLARERTAYALNYMKGQLSGRALENAKFKSSASVAQWSDVVELMRKDSLYDEAKQVEDYAQRYGARASVSMRHLAFYDTLLLGKYLPKLRKVEYNMNYSIYRRLTLSEIKDLYNKDYRQLSRYEFFQLYRNEKVDSIREKYCRQALEMYPSFMIAANDLQVLLLSKKKGDPELLAPYVGSKVPNEVNINHIIAGMESGFTPADSLLDMIPDNEDTRLIKAVARALNGNYSDYETIAATSPQNKVAILLAMKKNEEATKACDEMPDSLAATHYLKAICYNRTGESDAALEVVKELRTAFRIDPALKEYWRNDGDLNSIKEEDIF